MRPRPTTTKIDPSQLSTPFFCRASGPTNERPPSRPRIHDQAPQTPARFQPLAILPHETSCNRTVVAAYCDRPKSETRVDHAYFPHSDCPWRSRMATSGPPRPPLRNSAGVASFRTGLMLCLVRVSLLCSLPDDAEISTQTRERILDRI
jgi:hypothetical protein